MAEAQAVETEIAVLEPMVKRQESQVAELQSKLPRDEGPPRLSLEQTLALQAASGLIDRKAFSWSILLSRLEAILPDDVRVLNIGIGRLGSEGKTRSAVIVDTKSQQNAQARQSGNVNLTLEVVGQKPSSITDLIARMNESGPFSVQPRTQSLMENGEVIFELDVEYDPAKPSRLVKKKESKDREEKEQ